MISFGEWIIHSDLLDVLRLLENAQFFQPQSYNSAFDGELQKLLARLHDPDVRQQISTLNGYDWGSYIARSLARAGFRHDDLQEHLHAIVVKLLVSPGGLFKNWNPERHSPLERRFRASVWNGIRNAIAKQQNYRRWMVAADPAVMAERNPAQQPYSSRVLEEFRKLVGEKLGKLATAVLDWRLEGRQTKELIGRPELGSPSIYNIKMAVQEVKQLAHRFAAQSGDSEFLAKVEKALAGERATVAKRQAAVR
jgi:hypothetical protein